MSGHEKPFVEAIDRRRTMIAGDRPQAGFVRPEMSSGKTEVIGVRSQDREGHVRRSFDSGVGAGARLGAAQANFPAALAGRASQKRKTALTAVS